MRIPQFYCLQWFYLTILCTIFFFQKPTLLVGLIILILISIVGIYLYTKGKQHACIPFPKSTIVIGYSICFLLVVGILIFNHSTILFIGILFFIIVLMYIIQQFISESYIQTVQLQQLENNIHQFNDSYNTVSAQRHDFMKHVLALAYFLEKDELTEAKSYMEQLIPDYQWVNLRIRGERGHAASLLLYYQQIAQEKNVAFLIYTNQPLSRLPLIPHEQVQLIGNLLENAIYAAEETLQSDSFITIHTQIVSGLYKLEVSNATNPIPSHIVDNLFSNSRKTTKQHGQGIGTSIIANLVKSNNGTLKYTYYGNKIIVRIALPMIGSST